MPQLKPIQLKPIYGFVLFWTCFLFFVFGALNIRITQCTRVTGKITVPISTVNRARGGVEDGL